MYKVYYCDDDTKFVKNKQFESLKEATDFANLPQNNFVLDIKYFNNDVKRKQDRT